MNKLYTPRNVYDTLLPSYVHVFQTVIPRNRLPRMFSMKQAKYSTVIFLRGLCKFAISTNHLPILHRKLPKNPPRTFTTSPSKKGYTYTRSLQKNHTPELEVYA